MSDSDRFSDTAFNFFIGDIMMHKKIMTVALFLILSELFPIAGFAQTPEESLKKAFPKLKFDRISPSHIKGIYEIISANGILYYSPETEDLFVGEIISKDGRNLTEAKKQEIISTKIRGKMKEIPLDKAISIGKGKHTVIEITDPDCHYCRRASEFFSKRTDVTRSVFFFPLAIHPQSKEKALFVLCSENKTKAYEDAMTGKLDDMKFKICDDPQAPDLLKTHMALANTLEIRSTPFFVIDGRTAVIGADIPQLKTLLGDGQ
jgi:thiol:disulfide interchange protein DsbC